MKKQLIGILAGAGILLFLLPPGTGAQGESAPEFLMTWRADSYVPAHYTGKALPAPGSNIIASFELIQNGAPLDISNETVYWYMNRKPIREGLGLKTISFRAPETPGGMFELRARINNFRDESATLLYSISIPVAAPEAVIEAPFPDGHVRASTVRLMGYPYFFNISDPQSLSYSWTVNGEVPAGSASPNQLDITVVNPRGVSALSIDLVIQGEQSLFDSASKNIRLVLGQ